jgi:hypothetical protein
LRAFEVAQRRGYVAEAAREKYKLGGRSEQMRAFALMRQPDQLEAAFVSSPHYRRAQAVFDSLRAALPAGLPLHYRGIGRFPFTEYPERGPGWQGEPVADDGEARARELLVRSLGPWDYQTPSPRAFLSEHRLATGVHTALLQTQAYEIVEICVFPEVPSELLGFDVGYWGGGNFSILCDTAIWPTWHPPTVEAIPELVRHVTHLNQHALFPTNDAASEFAAWYTTQPWAEDEPEGFTVVAVGNAGAG